MDPLNEFQQKETEKLSSWFSGIYSTKEAKVHTADLMASSSQRSPVVTETHDLGMTTTPHVPVSESKASSIPIVDLSNYYTKDEIDEKLEEYVTKEGLDTALEEYATKEWTQEQIDTSVEETKEWVRSELDKYATKEWVESKLKDFVTKDELSNYVRKDEFSDLWWEQLDEDFGRLLEKLYEYGQGQTASTSFVTGIVNDKLRALGVTASCQNGSVTVELTGVP